MNCIWLVYWTNILNKQTLWARIISRLEREAQPAEAFARRGLRSQGPWAILMLTSLWMEWHFASLCFSGRKEGRVISDQASCQKDHESAVTHFYMARLWKLWLAEGVVNNLSCPWQPVFKMGMLPGGLGTLCDIGAAFQIQGNEPFYSDFLFFCFSISIWIFPLRVNIPLWAYRGFFFCR